MDYVQPILTNDPSVMFSIGTIDIKWYGFLIGMAFIIVITIVCIKIWKWYKLPIDPFYYFCLLAIPSSILGARIGSVIIGQTPFNEFLKFTDSEGNFVGLSGLSIQYGVLFCALTAVIYFAIVLRKPKYMVRDVFSKPETVKQVSILLYLDAAAPAVLLGQAIGRWGNYTNQELYGPEVTNPSDFFKNLFPLMEKNGTWYEPWFFYESMANFIAFALIFFVIDKYVKQKKAGDLICLYFVFYGIIRLCLEPIRQGDSSDQPGVGHTVNLTTSILWIVGGIGLIVLNHLVLVKLRTKKLYYISWNETIIFFIRVFTVKINFKDFDLKNLKKLFTLKDLKNSVYIANRNKYNRTSEEMLYYRGL